MGLLSLILKIVAALATIIGIVSFVLDARGVTLAQVPQEHMKSIGASLILLAILLGTIDFFTSRNSSNREGAQVFNNKGDVSIGSIVNSERIKQLTIHQGDSPEEKKQKLEQAKRLIAQEILANIRAIDVRLGYMNGAMEPDDIEAKMQGVRSRVAPATVEIAAAGYRQLIAENRIGSLRQAINSSPLRTEFSQPLIQLLVDFNVETQSIRFFYDQLREVDWATESVFNALTEAARVKPDTSVAWRDYHIRRVNLAIETVHQRSTLAYLAGLKALRTLEMVPSAIDEVLDQLQHLTPRQLPSPATVQALMEEQAGRLEMLVTRKETLVKEGSALVEQDIEAFEQVDELFNVRPSDNWNEVFGKAISLRQYGRVTEAVAAFYKYGQMFSATDPTAERYAATAQAFTQQIAFLGLQGGVYLYQVGEGSAAGMAGLQVGDIIIEYHGKPITGIPDLLPTLSEAQGLGKVRIAYLRLNSQTGRFDHNIIMVEGGPLGAGLMPI